MSKSLRHRPRRDDRREDLADQLQDLGRLIGLGPGDVDHVLVGESKALGEQVGRRLEHVDVVDHRHRVAAVRGGAIAEHEDRRRIGEGIDRAARLRQCLG